MYHHLVPELSALRSLHKLTLATTLVLSQVLDITVQIKTIALVESTQKQEVESLHVVQEKSIARGTNGMSTRKSKIETNEV